MAASKSWHGRHVHPRAEMDILETWRGRQECAEDGTDVPRTGQTCRGRDRRAEDGTDVPTTGQTCRRRDRRAVGG